MDRYIFPALFEPGEQKVIQFHFRIYPVALQR